MQILLTITGGANWDEESMTPKRDTVSPRPQEKFCPSLKREKRRKSQNSVSTTPNCITNIRFGFKLT